MYLFAFVTILDAKMSLKELPFYYIPRPEGRGK